MATVFVEVYKSANRLAARSAGVQARLDGIAQARSTMAKANLASHRDRGKHRIEVEKGRLDRYVNLVGPGALSVETGHVAKDGTVVQGLNILRNT